MPWQTAEATVGVSREHTQRLVYSLCIDQAHQRRRAGHGRATALAVHPVLAGAVRDLVPPVLQNEDRAGAEPCGFPLNAALLPLTASAIDACVRVCWCSG